jgi:hypothetical protein
MLYPNRFVRVTPYPNQYVLGHALPYPIYLKSCLTLTDFYEVTPYSNQFVLGHALP